MSRSSKIKRYEWRVNGMMKCLDYWGELMQEPERDGAFHKWDHCEQQPKLRSDWHSRPVELAR